eukprot:CAMPEP_0196727436 /NCGR_PEP_ID=MMETSP1091-20130531/8406_1 /TAXON_ID=302021 /ORGANISM="Rhodomonas sp., Strain CCMP768" /LENGTH=310 /DNA_ID=CAMNT_0042070025 /DNA_START=22 /DNA_END=954 /DNA_ORIENTATION=+
MSKPLLLSALVLCCLSGAAMQRTGHSHHDHDNSREGAGMGSHDDHPPHHPGPPGTGRHPPGPGTHPPGPPGGFHPPPSGQLVCKDDFEQFCGSTETDLQAIVHCLDAHKTDLHRPCAVLVENATKLLAQFHEACDSDLQMVCQGSVVDTNSARDCVMENLASLSSPCLQAVSHIAIQAKVGNRGQNGQRGWGLGLFDQFQGLKMVAQRVVVGEESAPIPAEYAGQEMWMEPVHGREAPHQGHRRPTLVMLLAALVGAGVVLGIAFFVRKATRTAATFDQGRAPQLSGLVYPPVGTPFVDEETQPKGAAAV